MNIFKGLALAGCVFAGGPLSGDAVAAFPGQPTFACTAANAGQMTQTQMGNRRYDWYCNGSQWEMLIEYRCDAYGNNCVAL